MNAHNICEVCWFKEHPTQIPVRIIPQPGADPNDSVNCCCFCGSLTISGIFVRRDGKILYCKDECGLH